MKPHMRHWTGYVHPVPFLPPEAKLQRFTRNRQLRQAIPGVLGRMDWDISQTGLSSRNTRTGPHTLESAKVGQHLFQALRLFVQDADLLAQAFLHDAGALNYLIVAGANSL